MRPPARRALATADQRHRLHLHCAHGFATQRLARMLHSLVRVSRRVGCGHSGTNDRSARCDRPPAGHAGPSTATARSDRLGYPPDRSGPAPSEGGLRCNVRDSQLSSVAPGTSRRRAISSPRERGATYPDALLGRDRLSLAGSPQKCRVVGRPDLPRRATATRRDRHDVS